MSARRRDSEVTAPQPAPARTLEEREDELINLATDLAEKQLRDGTASAQVITLYLRYASPREKLEREKLQSDNDLLRARIDELETAKDLIALHEEAMNALRGYQGKPPEEEADEEYYD